MSANDTVLPNDSSMTQAELLNRLRDCAERLRSEDVVLTRTAWFDVSNFLYATAERLEKHGLRPAEQSKSPHHCNSCGDGMPGSDTCCPCPSCTFPKVKEQANDDRFALVVRWSDYEAPDVIAPFATSEAAMTYGYVLHEKMRAQGDDCMDGFAAQPIKKPDAKVEAALNG